MPRWLAPAVAAVALAALALLAGKVLAPQLLMPEVETTILDSDDGCFTRERRKEVSTRFAR